MSTDDEIPAVSDVENAKLSDGASTAGEHTVDMTDNEKLEEEMTKETTKHDIEDTEDNASKTELDEEQQNETDTSSTTNNNKIKTIDIDNEESNIV